MDLLEKIQKRQIMYYKYTVQCIDAYLNDDTEPLKNFLVGLSKLNKGELVLEKDFMPLVEAFKNHNVNILLYIKHKFECKK